MKTSPDKSDYDGLGGYCTALEEYNACLEALVDSNDEELQRTYEVIRAWVAITKKIEAELEKLKQQEPVAWKSRGGPVHTTRKFTDDAPLYLAAGAQIVSVQPNGWVRAADDEMINTHLGVADMNDSYESAKAKLKILVDWHITVATDPEVNGGYRLVPCEPTEAMIEAWNTAHGSTEEGRPVWKLTTDKQALYTYKAMLKAAKQ